MSDKVVGFMGEGVLLNRAFLLSGKKYKTTYYFDVGSVDCDVLFVMRYKKLIPMSVINKIPLGAVMIHYGKLPYYRGYYPINQAIRNGETEIGISMFYADAGVDTGDIIAQWNIQIGENETIDEIYQKCDRFAYAMFESNLDDIVNDKVIRKTQPVEGSVFKKDELTSIPDFSKDPRTIHNFIRSLTGKGQERAYIEDEKYRLYFDKTTLVEK